MMQAVDHPYLVVHSASAPGAAEAQKKLQEEEAQGLLQGTPIREVSGLTVYHQILV